MNYEAELIRLEEERAELEYTRWEKNNESVLIDSYKANEVTLLQNNLLKWQPKDIRLQDPDYDEVIRESSDENTFLIQGTEMDLVSARPRDNEVRLGIFIPSNYREYLDYNSLVDQYNSCLSGGFDPETGKISPVQRPVRYAFPTSRYTLPLNYYKNFLDEVPGIPAPKNKKKKVAELVARLHVSDKFHLSYAVYSLDGELLMQDKESGPDLSDLTLVATQRIFGVEAPSEDADLLDGLKQLLNGSKMKRRNTSKPEWVKGLPKKTKIDKTRWALLFGSWIFDRLTVISAAVGCILLVMTLIDLELAGKAFLVGVVSPFIFRIIGKLLATLAKNRQSIL